MKAFMLIFVVLILATSARAESLLLCDPYDPGSGISGFGVFVSGVTHEIPYSLHANGSAIVYRGQELQDDGKHRLKVWAISVQEGRDSVSIPFLLYEKLEPLSNIGYKP